MTRYYAETPCPECGQYVYGEPRYSGQHFIPYSYAGTGMRAACDGPGASRVELVVAEPDYSAALREFEEAKRPNSYAQGHECAHAAQIIIDAGLVGGVYLKEKQVD